MLDKRKWGYTGSEPAQNRGLNRGYPRLQGPDLGPKIAPILRPNPWVRNRNPAQEPLKIGPK